MTRSGKIWAGENTRGFAGAEKHSDSILVASMDKAIGRNNQHDVRMLAKTVDRKRSIERFLVAFAPQSARLLLLLLLLLFLTLAL